VRTKEVIDAEILKHQVEFSKVRGTKTEVYTRIVGYYRNVDNFNIGKREEYKERKEYAPSLVER
jgi:ribonucleoside-triphosphate reductase